MLAASAAMLTACNTQTKSNDENNSQLDSLQNIIDQKDTELNEVMSTLTEIQEGFNLINEAEGRVNMLKDNTENNNASENIRENMDFIQTTLAENKRKIADLEQRLKNNTALSEKLTANIKALQEQLETKTQELEELRTMLEAKDVKIAELDQEVSDLKEENTQVSQLREAAEQTVASQDAELHTAWYVFGTNKELKEHNILIKGNVLQGNYDKNYLTKIDIRKTTVIPFNSKSAELLTNHPAGSYTLLKDSKGEYTLRIVDASKFWSVSKYLVVKVK